MVNEAEENEAEDKARREQVERRNKLDKPLLHARKDHLREQGQAPRADVARPSRA
jgi:molecular chaperone DnaK (HSP70)